MKIALALLALVAMASARIVLPNFGRGELYKDIQEFLDMMPADDIIALTLEYFEKDKEFQDMVAYLQSDEFKQLVQEVEALPEIKVLMDYIHDAGIDIYQIINLFNDWLGLDHLTPPDRFAIGKQITGGFRGYMDDVLAMLPINELNDLYEKKLKESEDFAKFIAQLESENFQVIVDKVYANPKTQQLLKHAADAGVDLERIKELLKILWGIKIPPRPHF